MTTRKKPAKAQLKITQVHSIIGNQERVKRVVTDGLGLGRIGSSVVLPDNPYTRGMISKAAHIVAFEELAVEVPAAEPHAAEAPAAEAPSVETPVGEEQAPKPRPVKVRRVSTGAAEEQAEAEPKPKPRAPRKRAATKQKD
ncbi:MAG TPA: 50S ribosomal protein L30 [Solirubrobacteraceae bacterium]|nr:50S ribosomal protein L30 [Solirubrobacteraceae bacterium]